MKKNDVSCLFSNNTRAQKLLRRTLPTNSKTMEKDLRNIDCKVLRELLPLKYAILRLVLNLTSPQIIMKED